MDRWLCNNQFTWRFHNTKLTLLFNMQNYKEFNPEADKKSARSNYLKAQNHRDELFNTSL